MLLGLNEKEIRGSGDGKERLGDKKGNGIDLKKTG